MHKILPGLFEEFIELDDLSYYVKKISQNNFLCFAYDQKKIIDAIKKAGLLLSQIDNIYFSQIEFESIVKGSGQSCMKVDNVCLSFIDDKLVMIPVALKVDIDNSIDIQDLNLSKETISISNSSKYIQNKTAYQYSAVFVIFALFTFFKAFDNKIQINSYEDKTQQIKSSLNLPATNIQMRSIIGKLNKTHQKQVEIRELLQYLFDIKRKLKATVVSIDLKSNVLSLKLKGVDEQKITKYLEKRYPLKSAVVKEGIITIGMNI
ncbi:MAG: hypothetical protein U9Q33_03190 [Campylobacterota bacterium]|nr:hypothetical protein [Campylobacterota bacterium]